jgi:hypothetical protein
MTANETLIAETAINRRTAQSCEVIRQEVSHIIGISIIEVKKILDPLSREAILKQCATPTRNLAEGPIPPDEITWAWHEKKQCCP